jgi:hypothetical protein
LFCTPFYSVLFSVSSYSSSVRTPRKTPSSAVKIECLLVRYVAMDILLSRAVVLWKCVYRVVA